MKRIFTLLLIATICVSFCVPSHAAEKKLDDDTVQIDESLDSCENVVTTICNEYDSIISFRRNGESDLMFAAEDYARVKLDEAEKEFLRRAKLSDEELKNYYCYTEEQIEILRNYDGSALEDNPQMRSVAAELTASMGELVKTKTRMGIIYTWNWSNPPVAITKHAATVAWKGIYENGLSNNMRFDNQTSFCQIHYYMGTGAGTDQEVVYGTLHSSGTLYRGTYTKFPVEKTFSSGVHWAKTGGMFVYTDLVNQENGPLLNKYSVHGEYAENPDDVDFSVNIGVLSVGYSKTVNKRGIINITFTPVT